MLRDLISRFTKPGTPPPVLSQESQLSLSQRGKVAFPDPLTVAKVAGVAVAKVENPKIEVTDPPPGGAGGHPPPAPP